MVAVGTERKGKLYVDEGKSAEHGRRFHVDKGESDTTDFELRHSLTDVRVGKGKSGKLLLSCHLVLSFLLNFEMPVVSLPRSRNMKMNKI